MGFGIGARARVSAAWLLCLLALAACGEDALEPAPTLAAGDSAASLDGALGDSLASEDGVASADLTAGDAGTDDAGASDDTADGTDLDLVTPPDGSEADSATDDVAPDTGPACPGSVGCACKDDSACPSGSVCGTTDQGPQCLAPCLSGQPCATGTTCVTLPGADTTSTDDDFAVCAPKWPTLCDPCMASAQCAVPVSAAGPGVAAACVSGETVPGSSGWYCGTPCKDASGCPTGYKCASAKTAENGEGSFCLPDSGKCACSPAAIQKKATTTCGSQTTLPDGKVAVCVGQRTCESTELSACSAPVATTETCNNQDDDCDGVVDDGATCDDANPCTDDACTKGACVHLPNAATCSDSSACTTGDVCQGSQCGGVPVNCDDANPCTDDSCDPKSGCLHTNNAKACEDGDKCTQGDSCQGGKCTAGADICPCKNDGDCGDDGNVCNGKLICYKAQVPHVCKVDPTTVVVCDPKQDTVCHVNTCEPSTGACKPKPQNEAKACDDGSVCSQDEACLSGECTGKPVSCDDGNACTDDACDPKAGCSHTANTSPCSDGDACSTGDHCEAKACKSTPTACEDGFACTADACDKASGKCVYLPIGNPACGVAPAPYVEPFTCGSNALTLWQRSGADQPAAAVRWAFDATPAQPAPFSAACSLNVNNGKDLQCAAGQAQIAATADSPWIDASAVAENTPMIARMQVAGGWTQAARVLARLQGETTFTELVKVTPGSGWQPLIVSSKAWAGKKVQFRLELAGPCGGTGPGWFVDDFAVFVDACPGACPAGNLCSMSADGKAICKACDPGYALKDGQCTDVDECAAASTCHADATCANKPGSFTCTCKPGFSGDGKACADVDECATDKDDCAANAVCTNTKGGFTCACPKDLFGDGKTCVKKGSSQAVPAASCLEIHTLYPNSADGVYWLDVDGTGAAPAAQYLCDMKGGGWTLLIWDDFEDGGQKGWTAGPVSKCGKFGHILGGADHFGKGSVTSKTVAAPAHTKLKLSGDFLRIDSWDNETAIVQIDGQNVWTKKGSGFPVGTGSWECGLSVYTDEKWDFAYDGDHAKASVTVTATSTLSQSSNNEAFGIDNVVLWVK